MSQASKQSIPFGPQFSPEQTPLPELLGILEANNGDYDRHILAIQAAFFSEGNATTYNRAKKADNTTLALRAYGLLEQDKATLTNIGQQLSQLRNNPAQLYEEFGRHILLHLNGLVFVRTIQDLLQAGQEVSLTTLPSALRVRGVHVPATSTHLSAMKGWLKLAGIFEGGSNSYEVNAQRLQELLGGLSGDDLDQLAGLNAVQRAFLRALARFPLDQWSPSNEVAKMAEALYGIQFPWKGIASSVLDACREAGFLEYRKVTGGRGAKPHLVRATDKFVAEVLEPLLASYPDVIGNQLRKLLRTPLTSIIQNLSHSSKNVKGLALELLALHLMFTLDLEFVSWRKRGKDTGGAEVDVLMESARLLFSRWQIQCKNGHATLEDVAKEVGLAYHLNSNVILVLSTRRVSSEALSFANSIMRKSNLQVIVLQESHLRQILTSPGQLITILRDHSRRTMELKRLSTAEVEQTDAV